VAGTTGSVRELILRAYDAATGELLWELRRPNASPAALSVDAGLVFVAGGAEYPSVFLGAYDVTDGHLRWEDTSDVGFFFDVKARGRRLAAVGLTGTGTAIVRVYDAATGAVRWEDIRSPAPGLFEFYGTVDVSNKAIYVAGFIGEDEPFGKRDFLVRAYDLRTGALLFDDRSHSSFGSSAAAIAVDRHRVFAVGYTVSETSNFDSLSRAYNVKDIEAPGRRDE
jgi:outer membrane protein assembly factor BamB